MNEDNVDTLTPMPDTMPPGELLSAPLRKERTGIPGCSDQGCAADLLLFLLRGNQPTNQPRYIYKMQNLTFGADGGLTEQCQTEHPTAPGLCFMSPHMQDTIKTPYFMFNSKYDAWQLGSEFQSNWATKAEQDGVVQYGKDFLTQFAPVQVRHQDGA